MKLVLILTFLFSQTTSGVFAKSKIKPIFIEFSDTLKKVKQKKDLYFVYFQKRNAIYRIHAYNEKYQELSMKFKSNIGKEFRIKVDAQTMEIFEAKLE